MSVGIWNNLIIFLVLVLGIVRIKGKINLCFIKVFVSMYIDIVGRIFGDFVLGIDDEWNI